MERTLSPVLLSYRFLCTRKAQIARDAGQPATGNLSGEESIYHERVRVGRSGLGGSRGACACGPRWPAGGQQAEVLLEPEDSVLGLHLLTAVCKFPLVIEPQLPEGAACCTRLGAAS